MAKALPLDAFAAEDDLGFEPPGGAQERRDALQLHEPPGEDDAPGVIPGGRGAFIRIERREVRHHPPPLEPGGLQVTLHRVRVADHDVGAVHRVERPPRLPVVARVAAEIPAVRAAAQQQVGTQPGPWPAAAVPGRK